jgi:extracellular elastinolytic metalloproteinase
MPHKPCVSMFLTAAALSLAASVYAQGAAPFRAPEPRITRSESGRPLTPPSKAGTIDVVREFLRARGHNQPTLDSLTLVSEARAPQTGVTHARFVQRIQGVDVYGVYVKTSLDIRGQLTSVIENLVPVHAVDALIGRENVALASALRHLYGGTVAPPGLIRREGNTAIFARTAFFHREPMVTKVAVPFGAGVLRAGYLVETWSKKDNLLHHTLIGGDGAVLGVEERTSTDSYNVFTENPNATKQKKISGPAPGTIAESPQGWLGSGAQTTINISGNNAHAYLDTNADNVPDAGGTAVTDGQFLTAASLTTQPSTAANRNVAVQNLFFLNNVIHDTLYARGFTEAAGNFQIDNFGNGGADNDPVNAEAQDGSGVNNANFATPPDGSSPRMQMFLWNGPGTHQVVVNAPASIAGTYLANGAAFGPALNTTGITAAVSLVNDGTAPTADACERLPRASLTGRIALIDRGVCTFADKILNAQRAGAVAVVVANNQGDGLLTMGGTGSGVSIPSVFVGQTTGTTLKSGIAQGVNATVRLAVPTPLSHDGDVDSDVVFHEYGHGLTWRMIGSMSGAMSGAIGEGMSDVLAVLLNGDDRVGEYSAFNPLGIRTAPYTNYPRTYADFSGTEVHFDGEIYGAIGWHLGEIFASEGLTTTQLLGYLVDGMNYTPAGPNFEQMRDGILQAVSDANLGHGCLIWRGFADYGVGVGASAVVKGKTITITPSTDVPPECGSAATSARR